MIRFASIAFILFQCVGCSADDSSSPDPVKQPKPESKGKRDIENALDSIPPLDEAFKFDEADTADPLDTEVVVTALERLGATVQRSEGDEGQVTRVSFPGVQYGLDGNRWSLEVGDSHLEHLNGLTSLQELIVGNAGSVTDAGLANLKGLSNLEQLELNGAVQITDASLVHLAPLAKLTHLSLLGASKITGEGLAHLKRLNRLTSLDLRGARLAGGGLVHLAALTSLKNLHLYREVMSKSTAEELRKALPNCEINFSSFVSAPGQVFAPGAVIGLAAPQREATGKTPAERAVIQAIRDKGGYVMIERSTLDGDMLSVTLGRNATDQDLLQVKQIPGVNSLELHNCYRLSDRALTVVKQLRALHELSLGATEFSDAGFAHLADIKNLKSLDLMESRISDRGLAHLSELSGLSWLRLNDTNVTNSGLAHLAGLSDLRSLDLSNTGITDAGLDHLTGLTKLRRLDLINTNVTDQALPVLRTFSRLERIDVSNTKITKSGVKQLRAAFPQAMVIDKPVQMLVYGIPADRVAVYDDQRQDVEKLTQLGARVYCSGNGGVCTVLMNIGRIGDADLVHLKKLSSLVRLELSGSRVTDAGLEYLHGLKNLRHVFLFDTDVTAAGVKLLSSKLPEARIFSHIPVHDDFAELQRRLAEQEGLKGTWEVISSELGGKRIERFARTRYTFSEGVVTIESPAGGRRKEDYVLTADQDPKQLDIRWRSSLVPAPSRGIYVIEGDPMRWCWGSSRPSEFATQPDDGRTLLELKRVRKE